MTAIETRTDSARQLRDVLTEQQPLGPPLTEGLLHRPNDVFQLLYDKANHIHHEAHADDPPYIVGRKGAGKTAFLAGAPLLAGADVVLIESENIYSEVERLRRRYQQDVGPVFADTLVHVWEVLLCHAAMLGICRSTGLPTNDDRHRIWAYMTSFGDPKVLETDELLAAVSDAVSKALAAAPAGTPFRVASQQLDLGRGTFRSARTAMGSILVDRRRLYVVVDNLEDLHRRIDELGETITALFRVTTRNMIVAADERLPFSIRFAFPAELLMRLRNLAANPEKDFLGYLTIRWTASELIVLAGNRLRWFLDARFPDAVRALRLPSQHDPADREAAELTLRSLLPESPMLNGLGTQEDPVAYVMRHTQLLPRHLILSLNAILSETVRRQTARGRTVPRASATDVLKGVRGAEHTIVEGILTSYGYHFPEIAEALRLLKNRLSSLMPASTLHKEFNKAGVKRATGTDFSSFLDAALAIGAFGIATPPTERYARGEFAYTFTDDLRPVEDQDELCVHPLFMYRLFDRRAIRALAEAGTLPVYPYGSDPEDEDHDI